MISDFYEKVIKGCWMRYIRNRISEKAHTYLHQPFCSYHSQLMKACKTTSSTPCGHFSLCLDIHTPHCHHSVWFLSSHMNLWNSSLPCTVEEEILLEIFELEVTLEPKHWRNFCFLLHSLPWILICDSLLYSLGAKKKKI